jgi:Domain of unknown function (DUF1992)
MNAEERREQRLKLQDDHIGRALRESEASGELRTAPSFGKPMNYGDGYDETPEALRMGMKVLKDAGVVPPEVEVMREIAALQAQLAATADEAVAKPLRQRISEKQQALSLRLEKLRTSGSF